MHELIGRFLVDGVPILLRDPDTVRTFFNDSSAKPLPWSIAQFQDPFCPAVLPYRRGRHSAARRLVFGDVRCTSKLVGKNADAVQQLESVQTMADLGIDDETAIDAFRNRECRLVMLYRPSGCGSAEWY